ncbi:MAG: low molecular weight phosphotyrosine protein phosphatase [Ignavibacteriales bacterium]|nr:low molecular weight phosphotyrosine protein phosphatase [Ignavibacteriales bacterium]MCB9219411.1 low molecular weight phosphotyrosine protein phosphatase [Ignavibacteriales bacterium]MCB9259915.1 low molecular weight phosphotyrosine protein phosphatase [Ignavibacteriales bacterium]
MVNVIFVCMGNICRSPSGEAVMNKLVKRVGLENEIQCDSAGTIAYHEGEQADARMKRHAIRRGYKLTSIARRFRNIDFEKFDYVIAMDKANYADLISFDTEKKYKDKIFMMTNFSSNGKFDEVPDPYYGGPEGFETVLDILEDSCSGLLEEIKSKL